LNLKIPKDIIKKSELKDGSYAVKDQLYQVYSSQLSVLQGEGTLQKRLNH
jgi:hypothetical protein